MTETNGFHIDKQRVRHAFDRAAALCDELDLCLCEDSS